jgi:hypothetical protein
MGSLKHRGAEVAYYDPYVPVIRPTRDHPEWAGTKSVPWDRTIIGGFDAVIITTAHASVNYQELADWTQCIVDNSERDGGRTRRSREGLESVVGAPMNLSLRHQWLFKNESATGRPWVLGFVKPLAPRLFALPVLGAGVSSGGLDPRK